MESISKDRLLEFHPDTLQVIRKMYHLDQPGRMNEAIDILDNWVQKQNHFLKKDFARDFLERTIISTKGLIERAKKQLDKRCTMKTLMPSFFEIHDVKNDFQDVFKVFNYIYLPKQTIDHYRVSILRTDAKGMKAVLLNFYKFVIMTCEYLKLRDYSNGVIYILDYTQANTTELLSSINFNDLRQIMAILIEGYGFRIPAFYIINESKAIEVFVSFFKQILSTKLGNRIHVYSSIEAVYEHLPRDIFPVEYGGKERSIKEIQNDWIDILSSKEYIDYIREMYKAGTNELLRSKDVFNDQYFGMPGTFRTINVD